MSTCSSASTSKDDRHTPVSGIEKHNGQDVASAEIDLSDARQANHQSESSKISHGRAWQPGFWKQFPWLGFFCTVSVVALTLVAVGILVASDNKAVSQWSNKIAPNVILSLLNSGVSICFAVIV